jgi:hypothetical protein
MKVAVYFSGHLRTYDQTWDNWKKYVIDPLGADVFMATWPHRGTWIDKGVPFKPEPNTIGTVQRDTLINIEEVIKLFNPKKFTLLDEAVFENETSQLLQEVCNWRDSLTQEEYWGYMPRGNISQYYSWKQVDDLRKTYELESSTSYDFIIRARTDLLIEDYFNPFHLQIENTVMTQIRNDINDPLWLNDVMFMGTANVISNLCQIYDSYSPLFTMLKETNSPEWLFSSHKLIPYYLISTGCPWLEVPFPFKRYNHSLIRS